MDVNIARKLSNRRVPKQTIEFLFEDASSSFDPSFANNEMNKEFRIKLKNKTLKRETN